MTKTELKPLYAEAAARARSAPSPSELAVWFSQLGHGDIRDLRVAIDRAFALKPGWMPRESELKPLMEQAQKERLSQTREPEELTCWECQECNMRQSSFKVGWSPSACIRKNCNSITFRLLFKGQAA